MGGWEYQIPFTLDEAWEDKMSNFLSHMWTLFEAAAVAIQHKRQDRVGSTCKFLHFSSFKMQQKVKDSEG